MSNPVADESFERDGAGMPDGFQRLWAPYRMAYIKGENRATGDGAEECPFFRIPKLDDATGLIVARGELVYTVMNKYPYNAGHVMVVPYQHVVPRWGGDTNFMPVIAGTKVLPQLLSDTRDLLAAAWPETLLARGSDP